MTVFPPTDFIFPVWGAQHTALLLDYALPSLLAAENLPFWAEAIPSRLIFYACETAQKALNTYFQACSDLPAQVLFRPLPPEQERLPSPIRRYYRASQAYQRAITEANCSGHALIALTPDLILAQDCLKQLQAQCQRETEVLLLAGLRLSFESAAPLLEKWRQGKQLCISSQELVHLLRQHMHPSLQAAFMDAEQFAVLPSLTAEWLSEQHFLVRGYHLHPLYFRHPLPYLHTDLESYFPTLDGRYLQHYARIGTAGLQIVQDSSIMAISFGFNQHPPLQTVPLSALERQRLIHGFGQNNCEPVHRWFYEHPIVFATTP
ncbi:MAG: hypothetical protein AB7I41_13805 [Candidatus Sericytochromatia bacterium]